MSFEKLLARLGDKVHGDVLELVNSVKNQPLMVAPNMIDSYLRDALIVPKMAETINGSHSSVPAFIYKEINTGVLDVSGGMTARKVNVPCAKSPASYESIKAAMSAMLAQDVDFIVARFNSGGGVASQMTILSRWIKTQRPNVRLIACIDDHAYSAAYGIASAFDTIYVTETSGAGSIGVVLRTENEVETEGKVEYIYAGKKKVDGAMDLPLSKSARADYQLEVDRLYGLFTELVSDNLGISLETIVNTQAGTFHGEGIIDAGLAHKNGTFENVIDNIYSGEEMNLKEIEESEARIELQEKKLDDAKLKVANAKAKLDQEDPTANLEKQALANAAAKAEADEVEAAIAQAAKADQVKATADELDALKIKVEAAAKAKAESASTIRNICLAAGLGEVQTESFIAHGFSASEVSNIVADLTSTNDNVDTSKTIKNSGVDAENVRASWKKAFKSA